MAPTCRSRAAKLRERQRSSAAGQQRESIRGLTSIGILSGRPTTAAIGNIRKKKLHRSSELVARRRLSVLTAEKTQKPSSGSRSHGAGCGEDGAPAVGGLRDGRRSQSTEKEKPLLAGWQGDESLRKDRNDKHKLARQKTLTDVFTKAPKTENKTSEECGVHTVAAGRRSLAPSTAEAAKPVELPTRVAVSGSKRRKVELSPSTDRGSRRPVRQCRQTPRIDSALIDSSGSRGKPRGYADDSGVSGKDSERKKKPSRTSTVATVEGGRSAEQIESDDGSDGKLGHDSSSSWDPQGLSEAGCEDDEEVDGSWDDENQKEESVIETDTEDGWSNLKENRGVFRTRKLSFVKKIDKIFACRWRMSETASSNNKDVDEAAGEQLSGSNVVNEAEAQSGTGATSEKSSLSSPITSGPTITTAVAAGNQLLEPREMEYLVKLEGESYRKLKWLSRSELSNQKNDSGDLKIVHFHRKMTPGMSDVEVPLSVQEEGNFFLYRQVDRILSVRPARIKARSSCHQNRRNKSQHRGMGHVEKEYLVKWMMLGYSEATWEDESSFSSPEDKEKINLFNVTNTSFEFPTFCPPSDMRMAIDLVTSTVIGAAQGADNDTLMVHKPFRSADGIKSSECIEQKTSEVASTENFTSDAVLKQEGTTRLWQMFLKRKMTTTGVYLPSMSAGKVATDGAERKPGTPAPKAPAKPTCGVGNAVELSGHGMRAEDGDTCVSEKKEKPRIPAARSLMAHQQEGLKWLFFNTEVNRHGSLLADEMGLGKTCQSITFLEHFLDIMSAGRTSGCHALVVVQKSVFENWRREFQTWAPHLNVFPFYGGRLDRELALKYEISWLCVNTGKQVQPPTTSSSSRKWMKPDVVLVTYEGLRTPEFSKLTSSLRQFKWTCVVVDECQKVKGGKGSILLQNVSQLKRELMILLTGTPIQNTTEELFPMLTLLHPAKFYYEEGKGTESSVTTRWSASRFNTTFSNIQDRDDCMKLTEELHELMKPYILRREKAHVLKTLPPKTVKLIKIPLTLVQKRVYSALYHRSVRTKGLKFSNIHMQLRKCCIHPYLIEGMEDLIVEGKVVSDIVNLPVEDHRRETEAALGTTRVSPNEPSTADLEEQEEKLARKLFVESSGKFILLQKMLESFKNSGRKVLIFSFFKTALDLIEDFINLYEYPWAFERVDGHTSTEDRQLAIDRFNADPNRFLFLCTTRAGGVGINLTAASIVIHLDSDFNPQHDLQAQARCHRIGQDKNVDVFHFIAEHTYEDYMLFTIAGKKLGLEAVLLGRLDASKGRVKLDKQQEERVLRKGVFAAIRDDEAAKREATEFAQLSIEKILSTKSTTVVLDSDKVEDDVDLGSGDSLTASEGGTTLSEKQHPVFSAATFTVNPDGDTSNQAMEKSCNAAQRSDLVGLEEDQPDFWIKVAQRLGPWTLEEEKPQELTRADRRRNRPVNYRTTSYFEDEEEGSDVGVLEGSSRDQATQGREKENGRGDTRSLSASCNADTLRKSTDNKGFVPSNADSDGGALSSSTAEITDDEDSTDSGELYTEDDGVLNTRSATLAAVQKKSRKKASKVSTGAVTPIDLEGSSKGVKRGSLTSPKHAEGAVERNGNVPNSKPRATRKATSVKSSSKRSSKTISVSELQGGPEPAVSSVFQQLAHPGCATSSASLCVYSTPSVRDHDFVSSEQSNGADVTSPNDFLIPPSMSAVTHENLGAWFYIKETINPMSAERRGSFELADGLPRAGYGGSIPPPIQSSGFNVIQKDGFSEIEMSNVDTAMRSCSDKHVHSDGVVASGHVISKHHRHRHGQQPLEYNTQASFSFSSTPSAAGVVPHHLDNSAAGEWSYVSGPSGSLMAMDLLFRCLRALRRWRQTRVGESGGLRTDDIRDADRFSPWAMASNMSKKASGYPTDKLLQQSWLETLQEWKRAGDVWERKRSIVVDGYARKVLHAQKNIMETQWLERIKTSLSDIPKSKEQLIHQMNLFFISEARNLALELHGADIVGDLEACCDEEATHVLTGKHFSREFTLKKQTWIGAEDFCIKLTFIHLMARRYSMVAPNSSVLAPKVMCWPPPQREINWALTTEVIKRLNHYTGGPERRRAAIHERFYNKLDCRWNHEEFSHQEKEILALAAANAFAPHIVAEEMPGRSLERVKKGLKCPWVLRKAQRENLFIQQPIIDTRGFPQPGSSSMMSAEGGNLVLSIITQFRAICREKRAAEVAFPDNKAEVPSRNSTISETANIISTHVPSSSHLSSLVGSSLNSSSTVASQLSAPSKAVSQGMPPQISDARSSSGNPIVLGHLPFRSKKVLTATTSRPLESLGCCASKSCSDHAGAILTCNSDFDNTLTASSTSLHSNALDVPSQVETALNAVRDILVQIGVPISEFDNLYDSLKKQSIPRLLDLFQQLKRVHETYLGSSKQKAVSAVAALSTPQVKPSCRVDAHSKQNQTEENVVDDSSAHSYDALPSRMLRHSAQSPSLWTARNETPGTLSEGCGRETETEEKAFNSLSQTSSVLHKPCPSSTEVSVVSYESQLRRPHLDAPDIVPTVDSYRDIGGCSTVEFPTVKRNLSRLPAGNAVTAYHHGSTVEWERFPGSERPSPHLPADATLRLHERGTTGNAHRNHHPSVLGASNSAKEVPARPSIQTVINDDTSRVSNPDEEIEPENMLISNRCIPPKKGNTT